MKKVAVTDEATSALAEYESLVKQFRFRTRGVWNASDRCCLPTRRGVPECVYNVVDGADLTFTRREIEILHHAGLGVGWLERRDGMFVLDRDIWTAPALEGSMHDGLLANTLECASHPTRPIVLADETVVGVVLIDGCNAHRNMERYEVDRRVLMDLWQQAVRMLGVKPYYATTSIKEGWTVL